MHNPHIDELISLMLGPLTSAGISYLKGTTWTTRQRFAFAVLLSVVVGAANAYITNALVVKTAMTADDWITNILIVVISAQSTYKLLLEGTPTEQRLSGEPQVSSHDRSMTGQGDTP